MKNKVKDYIREKRNLKRLEFGCEVRIEEGEYLTTGKKIEEEILVFVKRVGEKSEFTLKENLGTENPYIQLSRNECEIEIIGLPIHLEDYLAVMKECKEDLIVDSNGEVYELAEGNIIMGDMLFKFSLTTGEPATDSDWEKLGEILVVK